MIVKCDALANVMLVCHFLPMIIGANATIFVVETVDGDVFGGFAAEQWHVNSSFYGSGESFIFKAGRYFFPKSLA